MKTQRRSAWVMWWALLVAATLPALAVAGEVPADSHAQMRAAMYWLATPWSGTQEKALESSRPQKDQKALLHLPGSSQVYSREQLAKVVPDWWPQDHPSMPAIVAVGSGKAMPCAECHAPNGVGAPHTATVQGLPAAYIVEQFKAFRDGSRANDEMKFETHNVTDAYLDQAAKYFSGMHLASARARVVETARVPKTRIESWSLVRIAGAGSEPIGDRIIELPVDPKRWALGDARTRLVAYVPPGSIARGQRLASNGAGVTTACDACHGPDLRGLANIPPLAGRSPTYLTRQLVQFALGNRHGEATLPMQQEVSHLSLKDMISVAAYAASLKP